MERGVTEQEVRTVLETGRSYLVRGGRKGKELAFPFSGVWRGRRYLHKLVRVIYYEQGDDMVVVTAVAQYGRWEE